MKPGLDYTGISTPFFCHDGQGNFLLQRRSQKCRNYRGCWDVGAGTLEFGEDPETGVLREVLEEYGVAGEITERLFAYGAHWNEADGRKSHWVAIPFFIKIDSSKIKIGDLEYIDEIGWFSLGALPTPLHPGVTIALARYPDAFARHASEKTSQPS